MATTLFPDASNTGVPAGVTLTPSGDLVITQAGAVISGLDIHGTVLIQAPNVTLENCKITSTSWSVVTVADGVTGAVVKNCEINGTGSGQEGSTGISGQGTFLNNNIYNVENGFSIVGTNVVIQGNYVHDMHASGSPHYDGIQVDGNASNVSISHNTIINNNGQTSAVMIDNGFGPISNIHVDDNLLVGGGYTVYSDGRGSSAAISGVSFTNNHIGGGQFGDTSFDNNSVVYTGNASDGASLAALLNTSSNVGGTTVAAADSSTGGSGPSTATPHVSQSDVVSNAPDPSTQGSHDVLASASEAVGTSRDASVAVDPATTTQVHTTSDLGLSADTTTPASLGDPAVLDRGQVLGTADVSGSVRVHEGSSLLGTGDAAPHTSDYSQVLDPAVGATRSELQQASGLQFTDVQQARQGFLTFSGTSDPNSQIDLYHGGRVIGTTTADQDGNWNVVSRASLNHSQGFSATTVDSSGDGLAAEARMILGSHHTDNLVSTSANETFAGRGGADTFVFANNFGHDVITDFAANGRGHDAIDFSRTAIDSFASVLAHASQAGTDVTITSGSDSLTLKNTKLGALDSHDFHFG